MSEPKLSTSGIRFIQNPLAGHRDLGITYGPGEPDYRPPPRGVLNLIGARRSAKNAAARNDAKNSCNEIHYGGAMLRIWLSAPDTDRRS